MDEIKKLEQDEAELIGIIKQTKDNAELLRLGAIVTKIWARLDALRELENQSKGE